MIDWLYQQFPSYQLLGSKAYKPTLENTHKILDIIGNPEKELKFIHVAGSNGKGSVCSLLSSALTESGLKVGLFTSPHILEFQERIRVNGVCIQEENVNSFIKNIRETELDFSPSFFEITFGMALDHFRKEECDICVIETGLGGRLDATNVITPLLSVITTISLEHTNILGETLGEIAFEKAGIIKPNVKVVLGSIHPSIHHVFEKKAQENTSEVIWSKNTQPSSLEESFIADYQKENFKTALTAINELNKGSFNISTDHIKNGIENLNKNTGYSGRLQIVDQNPLTIFDVSHNADGIQTTFDAIKSIQKGNLHIIYGTSADKDLKLILPKFPVEASYYITEFSNPRTAKIEDLKTAFELINLKSTLYYSNASEALKAARSNSDKNDTILVIGSFFLLSDIF
ncbi:MAG: dihydrofolate synthase/folylpolyglutamate synthase [Crocinitomicaceae bacterium]